MSDPLSTAANVFATVGFSAGFSGILFKLVSSIQNAPQEIRHLAVELEAMSATFAGIEAISRDLPSHNAFSEEFLDRLRSCMADLEDFGRTVEKLEKGLGQNLMRKSLARVQWPYNESAAIQFSRRVQSYHVTLSLALMTLQIKLAIAQQHSLDLAKAAISTSRNFQTQQAVLNENIEGGLRVPVTPLPNPRLFHNDQTTSSPFHTPETVERAITCTVSDSRKSDTAHDGSTYNVKPSSSLRIDSPQAVYESHTQPTSVRATRMYQQNTRCIKVTLWRGPLYVQRWHPSRQPAFGSLPQDQGYGVGISFAFPSPYFTNATFTTFFLRQFNKSWMSTSVHWNLSLPAVVEKDSEIVEFASLGNLEAMLELFRSGRATPTDVTPDGSSLLHVAVRYNHLEICRRLLQEGADVNASDEDGDTPLHIAVSRSQNYGIVRLLIENGADPGNCNTSSETPLHTAFNETVRQLLLYHSDKIESGTRNSRGMTLLHFVTQSSKSTVDTVRRLVERGCSTDPILKDYRGRSALHLAAQRGNIAVISYLVGLGAHVDVRCRDARGRTALHYAVESRRTEAIKVMVSLGADIRANDYGGRSILHHAAWRRNLEAVKHVVELGAVEDLLTRDIEGKTPLDLAIEEGATEVVEFLRRFMASCGMSLERPSPPGYSRPGSEGKRSVPQRGAKLAHPWSGGSEWWGLLLGCYGTAARVIGRLRWVDLAVVLTLSCSFVLTVVLQGSGFPREYPAL